MFYRAYRGIPSSFQNNIDGWRTSSESQKQVIDMLKYGTMLPKNETFSEGIDRLQKEWNSNENTRT